MDGSTSTLIRYEYNCQVCGLYSLEKSIDRENNRLIQALYYFILNEKSANIDVLVVSENTESVIKEENGRIVQYISEEDLITYYPIDFSQKVDKSLLNLSKVYSEYDSYITIQTSGTVQEINKGLPVAEKIKNLIFVDCGELTNGKLYKITSFLDLIADMELIKKNLSGGYSYFHRYTISSKGWLHIQGLQKDVNVSNQAFVAMWFDTSANNTWEMISRAIRDSGYIPVRIDEKEHNNQIVPEILYEIRKSHFVIADLTGHRNGVYYEAGYAKALNKEVILTCSEKDFENRHFDIAQQSIIKWKEGQELYDRLVRRIEATVGRRK